MRLSIASQQRCIVANQLVTPPGRVMAASRASSTRRPLPHKSRAHALRRLVAQSSKEGQDVTQGFPGGPPGGPPGDNGSGGRGGGGDGNDGNNEGDGNGGNAGPAGILLASKLIESLPADMAEALRAGKLPEEILQRFLDMNKNPFLAWLLRLGPFRERLLADPSFMVKMGIELGIGVCTKVAAEYNKRGENFSKELDFVLANALMAIVADFMLVYLPAPAFSVGGKIPSTNPLAKVFAGCPENAFQKVPPGYAPFSFGQRVGAVIRNGLKLMGVGMFASMLGVGFTNLLLGVRQLMDPTFVPLNPPQDVLVMSASYGSYMASSSNLRYQIVAGLIEERGIEVLFKGNPSLCHTLSFIVRTANTYLGSLLWVDYIRLLGVQKKQ